MRFPQEVVVQAFLPTYRALVARALSERGLSQEAVAELVGVSQAQVSKYLADKVDLEPAIAQDPRVAATVLRVSDGLASGRMDPVSALAASLELIRTLENRGPLCQLHEQRMPALAGTGCDACIDSSSRIMAEHEVLVELRLALRRLLAIPALSTWIPHVGSNLARAMDGAGDLWDIAALPGRIDVVGERPRAATEPAFGGSSHVATVILAVLEVHPGLPAALNIAYREALIEAAGHAGLRAVQFDASYDGRRDEVVDQLREAGPKPPDVLYHQGAFGIEPVAYVLGTDALDAVARTRRLLAAVG